MMGTVRLGPACGRIMLDFNGALCLLVPGHLGPCDAGAPPPVCGATRPVESHRGWREVSCRLGQGHAGLHVGQIELEWP